MIEFNRILLTELLFYLFFMNTGEFDTFNSSLNPLSFRIGGQG